MQTIYTDWPNVQQEKLDVMYVVNTHMLRYNHSYHTQTECNKTVTMYNEQDKEKSCSCKTYRSRKHNLLLN